MEVNVQSFREFKSSQMATAAAEIDALNRYIVAEQPNGYGGPPELLSTYPMLKRGEAISRRMPLSQDLVSYVSNRCLDALGRRYANACSLFVGYSGSCLSSLRAANENEAISVVYRGAPHGEFFQSTVNDELREDGYGGINHSTPRMIKREQMEYETADIVWVPSDFTKESLVDHGITGERIEVFPYGVDIDIFEPKQIDGGDFVLLYVGAVSPEKGIHVLLEAFNAFEPADARLVLLGKPDERLEDELERRDDVHAPGWVERHELAKWYQRADVFVFPSLADGYPSAVIEALACGCPVIVTDRVGTRDFVEHYNAGRKIPPHDVDALVTTLRELYDDEKLRRSLGANAIEGLESEGLALKDRIELMSEFLIQLNEHTLVAKSER